jgi:integrase
MPCGPFVALRPSPSGSGKSRIVTRRLACNPRLRNALYHWARVAAQLDGPSRPSTLLAMFNLAIDSKPRACDLTALRVDDVAMSGRVKSGAIVFQKKTCRPVQFEITEQTRDSLARWIDRARLRHGGFLFPSRICARRPANVPKTTSSRAIAALKDKGWQFRSRARRSL